MDAETRSVEAKVAPKDKLPFCEELATQLSNRDRDLFLDMLDYPPAPNAALIEAAARHLARGA